MNRIKVKKKLNVNTIEEEYIHALQKLTEDGDLECVLFLRLLWEAGLRPMDALDLHPSEIIERRIHRKSLKTGKYENYNIISEETEKIVLELLKQQGKFFSKSREYYFGRIRKSFVDPQMSVWEIVKYSREPLLLYRLNDKKYCEKIKDLTK